MTSTAVIVADTHTISHYYVIVIIGDCDGGVTDRLNQVSDQMHCAIVK